MRLRYIAFGVRHMEAQAGFLREAFALVPESDGSDCARFSAPGSIEPAVTMLRPAPCDRVDEIAFGVDSPDQVDQIHGRLVERAADLVERPGPTPDGGYGFRLFDPEGHLLSIAANTPSRTPPGHRSGHGQPLDLSHVVLNSPDIAALAGWYCAALGFRITDWLEDKLVFMTTSRYHHQIALAAAPHPGLNHVAYECSGVDDFMRATGRTIRLGHPLLWGPGRHGPGDNTFAYFRSPAGFILEFTTGLELTDNPDWAVRNWASVPEQSDLWGTANPRPNDAFIAPADPGLGILPGSPHEA